MTKQCEHRDEFNCYDCGEDALDRSDFCEDHESEDTWDYESGY